MEAEVAVEELTSGASGRLIPVFRNLRQSILSYQFLRRFLLLFYSLFLWILLLLPRRQRFSSASSPPSSPKTTSSSIKRRKLIRLRDEEDTLRRRALAEAVEMVTEDIDDMNSRCQWTTSLFFGDRQNALFFRSWFPVSGDLKGILIIIHGLNEHSGRYTYFAKQLVSCNFGVYAMDWMGHGGSDGLHGYVPSLDHVVADTGAFLEKNQIREPRGTMLLVWAFYRRGCCFEGSILSPHRRNVGWYHIDFTSFARQASSSYCWCCGTYIFIGGSKVPVQRCQQKGEFQYQGILQPS